ncbi:hypothetical protein AB0N65_11165 [Paenarthrobacter sp. NPDC089322]|uniref:hypothetical protein n=1 Tax=Paenarthrobacter sp. NPDC089322 TaxID=3155065 RepID=UPI003426B5DB
MLGIKFLSALSPGDRVEVYGKRHLLWRGYVETIAPELGIFWIQTDAFERRLLDLDEHNVFRLRPEDT